MKSLNMLLASLIMNAGIICSASVPKKIRPSEVQAAKDNEKSVNCPPIDSTEGFFLYNSQDDAEVALTKEKVFKQTLSQFSSQFKKEEAERKKRKQEEQEAFIKFYTNSVFEALSECKVRSGGEMMDVWVQDDVPRGTMNSIKSRSYVNFEITYKNYIIKKVSPWDSECISQASYNRANNKLIRVSEHHIVIVPRTDYHGTIIRHTNEVVGFRNKKGRIIIF